MQQEQVQNKKPLCKKCKKNIRVTLFFCENCRQIHNKKTRELKRKYRAEGNCVMCAKPSDGRRLCKVCQIKTYEYIKNSKYIQSKKAKQGSFGGLKQLSEVI